MNIFFDMDDTLIDVQKGLRPQTQEVFQRLKEDGHTLYIWSGVGVRTREVRSLGLETYVDGVFQKPLDNHRHHTQRMLELGEIPVLPDLVVDDDQVIVSALGGVQVQPYANSGAVDTEMERVYRAITEHGNRSRPPETPA